MTQWDEFERTFPLLAQSLRNAKNADRLGSAFLLVSSNPGYRMKFPAALAMLVVCQNPRPDGVPCGSCRNCSDIAAGIYPDLFLLSPTSKSRMITTGDSENDPDSLRSFQYNFYLRSARASGWKIGIVQDCDTMNENAQNAFLKTLEEPPGQCLFILTTGRPGVLLPTIRSRCQRLILTDNRCVYEYSRFPGLPELLKKLACDAANNLAAAEDCACGLIGILAGLDTAAGEYIDQKWKTRFEAAQQLEDAGIKLLERRRDAEKSCEYRRLREQFISILHTFFAQLALLSAGMDKKLLPNPEVMKPFFDANPPPAIGEREAMRMLSLAEEITNDLRTNINDALAVRAFVFSIAIRKEAEHIPSA